MFSRWLTALLCLACATAASNPFGPGVATLNASSCPTSGYLRLVNVGTAAKLGSALSAALPGDLIQLAPATYNGRWTITRSGTAANPITLCGPRTAILNGGSISSGNGLGLSNLKYWTLKGFTITNSKAGLAAWGSSFNVVESLAVHDVGQAGMHVREFSKHNILRYNKIWETGRYLHQYGEGIYIGTYSGQWCDRTNCLPDNTDSNTVYGNVIGPKVRADLIDTKSGTHGTIVRKNTGDGSGMVTDPSNPVWVLANGNGMVVDSNTFTKALTHGIKVRSTDNTWAKGSVIRANHMTVNTSGRAISVETPNNSFTTVKCDNVRTDPGTLSNVTCTP